MTRGNTKNAQMMGPWDNLPRQELVIQRDMTGMTGFPDPELVGGIPTPLKNMSSSMGRVTSHILWKIKNVPNHQPVQESMKCHEMLQFSRKFRPIASD